jgi:putative transposase
MAGISKEFFLAQPGSLVRQGDRRFRITHLINTDSVLAVDQETQKPERLRIETVRPVEDDAVEKTTQDDQDLSLYSDEAWAEAQRRFQVIKPLLENPVRSREEVEAIGLKYGVSRATMYRWLGQYQFSGHVSGLVPEKIGRKVGLRLINPSQEAVIRSAIEDVYLTKQRHKIQTVVDEVFRRCRAAKIVPPGPSTIRRRIMELSPAAALRRRGMNDVARNRYEAIQGSFPGADYPLAVVQIDHTEADLILVDEVHRKPICRPWVTLAIDVHSRMVVGLYVSLEKPSVTSVGMCMSQAMCSKSEYLNSIGVTGSWPVWGVMTTIHADNAKEFRGKVLSRACEEYDMHLQWRPVLVPKYGGHIERLMGTMANELSKLSGTTFSNIGQRKGYDSEKEATYTLKEFERYLVDFIVNIYHQRVHSELFMPPIRKWESGILGDESTKGIGIPAIPKDPLRVQLDFMPIFHRSIQQYGLQINEITYYDKVLDPYVNAMDPNYPKQKQKFLIRRDPRDISKVYFFDPGTKSYAVIPYRNIGLPAISHWELRKALKELKEKGRAQVNEHVIFEAIERMRSYQEAAAHKTKSARRNMARTSALKKREAKQSSVPATTTKDDSIPIYKKSVSDSLFDDALFDQEYLPYDDLRSTR